MIPSYGRTQEQHDNVQKLIDGLKALPDDYRKLHMKSFAENNSWAKNATPENPCGTCMCIIGHGPSLGIPFINKDKNDWNRYSTRAFGFCVGYRKWSFCFSPYWPNNIKQAIARLEMAQRGDIPNYWNYECTFTETEQ